jgi:hypothetical protein
MSDSSIFRQKIGFGNLLQIEKQRKKQKTTSHLRFEYLCFDNSLVFAIKDFSSFFLKVMKDLQRYRQGSKVFAGKHGFITLRDLFKWADRRPSTYEELAKEGYMLLAERLRNAEEKYIVKVSTFSIFLSSSSSSFPSLPL